MAQLLSLLVLGVESHFVLYIFFVTITFAIPTINKYIICFRRPLFPHYRSLDDRAADHAAGAMSLSEKYAGSVFLPLEKICNNKILLLT